MLLSGAGVISSGPSAGVISSGPSEMLLSGFFSVMFAIALDGNQQVPPRAISPRPEVADPPNPKSNPNPNHGRWTTVWATRTRSPYP